MDLVIEWGKMMKLQLMKKTKDELKDIAKVYGIKGISKLNKEALCDEIMPVIINEATNQMTLFDKGQLELVSTLMTLGEVTDCEHAKETYGFLEAIGHVAISKDGIVTLPEEIKVQYEAYFASKGAVEVHTVKTVEEDKLNKYSLAATHLYGAVEVAQVKALYERFENEVLDEKAYVDFLTAYSKVARPYRYIDGYVVAECLCLFEMMGFMDLVKNTKDKTYYEPTKEQFMRYSDENYYEHTLHIERLQTHLRTMYKLEETDAKEAVFDLCLGQQISTRAGDHTLQHTLSNWNSIGIRPRTKEEANKLVELIIKVMNSTRVWLQKGFTIDEVNGVINVPINKTKVGRNDNCPCGSGKKYKKCCGK